MDEKQRNTKTGAGVETGGEGKTVGAEKRDRPAAEKSEVGKKEHTGGVTKSRGNP